MYKIILITQARTSSTRLPGKVLKQIGGKSLLEIHLQRLKRCKTVSQLLVATTDREEDTVIADIAEKQKVAVFRGSLENVLDRFYQAAKKYQPDYVVRITSDCPLIDPELVDSTISTFLASGADYCANTLEDSFPNGQDVEVFKFSALETAWRNASDNYDKEHVTPYIYSNSDFRGGTLFKAVNHKFQTDYSLVRMTVDVEADFEVVKKLIAALGEEASWKSYADYYLADEQLQLLNKSELIKKRTNIPMITNFSKSDKMIKRAQEVIPGGAHTYSKGPDQSPALGPKMIKRGKAAHVWDVDDNEYIDWAMGLTAVSLGHAFEPVLEAVRAELENGVNFQCPSPIETELAELFLSCVPSADMVKFAKNGSTVTTAALKLARAYTGKKYVAFCSDHGFFSYDDWYIGLKACNSGVPEEIAALSLSFKYNDIKSVEALFEQYPNQIAGIILEPMEFDFPKDNFLHKVQALCKQHGTVFILDEMITGFKLDFPGAHTMLGIEPDLTTWGKGVANGFSTCMLAGKKEIMNLGGINHDKERVFLISTTHGAETHSLAAAIAAIKYTRDNKTIASDHAKGLIIEKEVNRLIEKHGLQNVLQLKGHPCWLVMFFKDKQGQMSDGLKTLFFQEMIKHGVLFRGVFNISVSHTQEDLDRTFVALEEAMKVYKLAVEEGYQKYLVGEPVKPVFRKFN